jgi:hypothetical protein
MAERKTEIEFQTHSYVLYMQDKYDAYRSWLRQENLPAYNGEFVRDVRVV